jgi:alpha-galactosidase
MKTPFLLAALLLLAGRAHAQAGFEQWEPEIQKFEAADKQSPPAPGGVVFVGSSTIRMWDTLAQDFPGVPVLNRGFGGSQLADAVHFADRIVIPYRPRLVMVYSGDNDLNAGKSPERVLADYRALVEKIHAALPQARIGFLSIKPSPSRWKLAAQMKEANALVKAYSATDPRLFYVDTFTPMLRPDGTPRAELFREDMLHMNPQGYALWKSIVAPYLAPPGERPQARSQGAAARPITVSTARSALRLAVAPDGRLYELGYGSAGRVANVPSRTPAREDEFQPPSGNGFISEPALQVVHADGNTSTDLVYQSHETAQESPGVTVTRILLKDRYYPFYVTLGLRAFRDEDVIEQWMEVRHTEAKPVVLARFASSAPVLKADSYYLTQLQGDYAREAELVEERLTPGIKVLDSKLGVRADQMRNPSFILSLDGPAKEEEGEALGGSLEWSGSFQLAFEVDWEKRLRVLAGINPFASEYRLKPDTVFRTPGMLWTWSDAGKGQVSRNLHRWARRYAIRDGDEPRPILLNNWEATYFDFDEQKIVSLFDGAKELGVDLFLLDDGWFGNKYPRNNDRAGLGDWEVNRAKLPHGLGYLAQQAKAREIGFGIWIEPEMVNPKSELFEKHPEWAIQQPHRELQFGRNQLVLDLSRPAVRDFVWGALDRTLGTPGVGYVKWDANRYLTQPGSTYLGPEHQQELTIDYQWALYDIMRKMATKYPDIVAMLCSGGSGRVDYGSLRYFDTFWPSDNTDPLQRIYIQWGFSQVFPAIATSNHVTDKGNRPVKFALDVAMTGALGVDRDVSKMTPEERAAVKAGIEVYRDRVRDVVMQGDLYRLESPYGHRRAALDYVSSDRDRAVLFVYQLGETALGPVKPRGLDPAKRYRVRELNLPAGARSRVRLNNQLVDGATLMQEGIPSPLQHAVESSVIELVAEGGAA